MLSFTPWDPAVLTLHLQLSWSLQPSRQQESQRPAAFLGLHPHLASRRRAAGAAAVPSLQGAEGNAQRSAAPWCTSGVRDGHRLSQPALRATRDGMGKVCAVLPLVKCCQKATSCAFSLWCLEQSQGPCRGTQGCGSWGRAVGKG